MFVKLRRWDQVGDTMVEVLVAMAVVSMILGGAYVTSNKSLLMTRDAQEHVQALKLADAQLELLSAQPPSSAIRFGGAFCYGPAPTYTAQSVVTTNCTLTTKGSLAPIGFQPAYSVKINYDANQLYTVQVAWTSVTGQGSGQVTMFYRTDK